MATKKASTPPADKEEDALLRVSQTEAIKKITDQIEKGRELEARDANTEAEYNSLREEKERWSARNEQLLGVIFSNSALKNYYRYHGASVIVMSMYDTPIYEHVRDLKEGIARKINVLQSVIERIDLFPEETPVASGPVVAATPTPIATRGTDIFVVHGHDHGTRDSVARYIEKLKLNPVILDEQANEGKTVIEKFERHARERVGFAVVVMTPDDIGGAVGTPPENLKPRARQNVIFELGYFFGQLGRDRVVALHGGVEIPSDISGVIYIPLDAEGVWRIRLAKEIKAAGLAVDLNDAL